MNSVNILAGDDAVPIKFGPKGTDPQTGRMRVSHMECCAVSVNRPPGLMYVTRQVLIKSQYIIFICNTI